MLERVEERGDLFAPVLELEQELPGPLAFVRQMVDWGLARQIARFAARSDDVPDLGVDLAALAREIEPAVAAHARPRAARRRARPRRWSAATAWAEANLVTLSVAARPGGRAPATTAWTPPGPFAGALRARRRRDPGGRGGPGHRLHVPARAGPVRAVAARPRGAGPAAVRGAQPRARGRRAAARTARASCAGSPIHELVHALQFGGVPVAARPPRRPAARVPGHRRRADRARRGGRAALAARPRRAGRAVPGGRPGGAGADARAAPAPRPRCRPPWRWSRATPST